VALWLGGFLFMNIEEAIAEARENVANNHTTEPCVIRRLTHEIERLRSALEECVLFTEMADPVTRVGKEGQKKALAVALSLLPNSGSQPCREPSTESAET
jgi:hypothetical protein